VRHTYLMFIEIIKLLIIKPTTRPTLWTILCKYVQFNSGYKIEYCFVVFYQIWSVWLTCIFVHINDIIHSETMK